MRVKYGTWNIGVPEDGTVHDLIRAGYSPLTAQVLSSRGCRTVEEAREMLAVDLPLHDPFLMKEMDRAVFEIRKAISDGIRMAVFGDYDVDGITATCLLVDYLRTAGADCISHIPGRLEEGYGLNAIAIKQLYEQGVRLIISVDCGITAIEEAKLCRSLGITLVITDHHECKEQLPDAAAVVDPHRPDRTYPHTNLSGVGIAFKLAAALSGDQDGIAERYCDLFCLGTVADVMPLHGENRRLVVQGLKELQNPQRMGICALIQACNCKSTSITSTTIGYTLAPRINAAGRMESAELAVELFLTHDEAKAEKLAQTLCQLNRDRQGIESEILKEAVAMLRADQQERAAIVLAGEHWHQGVVGIVASRLCEEYCKPTFLICLNGEHGKASSRSYGDFNLFQSLTELSDLLEGYGGHELAAGFTIGRENIDEFRDRMCALVEQHGGRAVSGGSLDIDGELLPELMTEENVERLAEMEPSGTGCPKPVFCISEAVIDRMNTVGEGKHLRLRLRAATGELLQAIFFSNGSLIQKFSLGDRVDVAFHLQINEYHGLRSVQLNLLDIRKASPTALYDRFCAGQPLSLWEKECLLLRRSDVAVVWNYIRRAAPAGQYLRCDIHKLCDNIAAGSAIGIRRIIACIDVLTELRLLVHKREGNRIELCILPHYVHNPLENSKLYCKLRGD